MSDSVKMTTRSLPWPARARTETKVSALRSARNLLSSSGHPLGALHEALHPALLRADVLGLRGDHFVLRRFRPLPGVAPMPSERPHAFLVVNGSRGDVFVFVLEIRRLLHHLRLALQHPLQARDDPLQRGLQRAGGAGHAPVEADQQQLPVPPLEGDDAGLEQVGGDVVVERALFGAHGVLEEPRLPVHEGLLEEALRLAAQGALQHLLEPRAQLVFLPGRDLAIVGAAEHLAEGGQITQQRAQRVDVLHQPPQLGEVVLDGRGGQQQHRACGSAPRAPGRRCARARSRGCSRRPG